MAFIKQNIGYNLCVGDIIIVKHAYGQNRYDITILSKKFAFAKVSEQHEAKFPLEYNISFQVLPKQRYHNHEYLIYTETK